MCFLAFDIYKYIGYWGKKLYINFENKINVLTVMMLKIFLEFINKITSN